MSNWSSLSGRQRCTQPHCDRDSPGHNHCRASPPDTSPHTARPSSQAHTDTETVSRVSHLISLTAAHLPSDGVTHRVIHAGADHGAVLAPPVQRTRPVTVTAREASTALAAPVHRVTTEISSRFLVKTYFGFGFFSLTNTLQIKD